MDLIVEHRMGWGFSSLQRAWPLIAVLTACGGVGQGGKKPVMPTTQEGFADQDTVRCSAVRPQTEPDLMGWDSGSRANLNRLWQRGVVAVRYEAKGCNVELEVLSDCIGDGNYEYGAYAATDTKLARNVSELYAQLPIGAASLSGKLHGDKALRRDYTLVGMAALPPDSSFRVDGLRGRDCSRATHVVSRIYLGAFAMTAGDTRDLEATTSVFLAKAGGSQNDHIERLTREGSEQACSDSLSSGKPNQLCSVPLRLGLLPLDGVTGSVCPADQKWDGVHCATKPANHVSSKPIAAPAENGNGAYSTIDRLLSEGFDYSTGHQRYEGTANEVLAAFNAAAKQARNWSDRLQVVIDQYPGTPAGVLAMARQASVYDSVWSGLYFCRAPALRLFDAQQNLLLERAEHSDDVKLKQQADDVRVRVQTEWRDKRETALRTVAGAVITGYARAIAAARASHTIVPEIANAHARLYFLSQAGGEDYVRKIMAETQVAYNPSELKSYVLAHPTEDAAGWFEARCQIAITLCNARAPSRAPAPDICTDPCEFPRKIRDALRSH